MKRLLVFLLLFVLGGANASENTYVRVSDSAHFKRGLVEQSTILSDEDATVFVEFPRSILATEQLSRVYFQGELLSPKLIEKPAENPKTRMKDLVSFEITTGEGEALYFTDRVAGRRSLSELERERKSDIYVAGALPVLVFVTDDASVRKMKLWRFVSDDIGWRRVGGVQEVLESGKIVFTVKLSETGKYTIFDEWPKAEGKVFDANEEYEQTLEYLEQKQQEIAAQIMLLKNAGVQSKQELQALQSAQQAENEASLFESNSGEFVLDPSLFTDSNTNNTLNQDLSANETTVNNTLLNPADVILNPTTSDGSGVGPTGDNFGLTLTPELGELSLASITDKSPQWQAIKQKNQSNNTSNNVVSAPDQAFLPEAGVSSGVHIPWSWNFFWLMTFFVLISAGVYATVYKN